MEDLKIIYLSPDELTPYENNTRKHSPHDIEQIKKSILAVGFDDPIGIWGDKNIIVEGHGRQIAAQELHLEKVPCIRLDHLTDAQRKDYAIRHNYTSDQSMFDFDKLQEEVAALKLDGLDMSYLDFDWNVDDMIPTNLDEEEGYSSDEPIACKLAFSNYIEYAEKESQIKEFAESIGAKMSVVKP